MTEIIIPILIIGTFFVVLYLVCAVLNNRYSSKFAPDDGFNEPETDAVFEAEPPPPPVLIECDTAGQLLPPEKVIVYTYAWNSATSVHEFQGLRPLSEYLADELEQPTAPPVSWDHNKVFPAPVPLDCALGASPLPTHGLN